MKRFMDADFLLPTEAAQRLYHEYAEGMPIFDFHCHLSPLDIASNKTFRSLAEAWLGGDHYKWRAMRASGVPESRITGDAPDKDKFLAWAGVVPATIGNPLYHWTHLELQRYFGVSELLGPKSAGAIYDKCTQLLGQPDFRVRPLLTRMNVRVLCTTDDPVDPLTHHEALRADPSFPITVVPTFRPDAAMGVDNPPAFNAWVEKLAAACKTEIRGWDDFIACIRKRHDFFHEHGCRASDHGLEVPYADECSSEDAKRIFAAARAGEAPRPEQASAFKSALMLELARMDAERNWVQQLHFGALRDVNSRALKAMGPNTGFDTTGDSPMARPLARFLDKLDATGSLPKTILFCLNPADNAVLATMAGCFPEDNVRGKVQFGAAWWFNDQKNGMEEQMRVLADVGLLARFVGMLTDSRSFLSFPRHEYFRRILCGMLGQLVEEGELPSDYELLGSVVKDICWNNAEQYFGVAMKKA
jgi:glucuronate isomerase